MRINTKLMINIFVPIAALLMVLVIMAVSIGKQNEAERKNTIAFSLLTHLMELNERTSYYLLYHEERAKKEWLAICDSLLGITQRFGGGNTEQRETIEGIRLALADMRDIFNKRIIAGLPSRANPIAKERQDRLASRLLVRSGSVSLDADRLYQLTNAERRAYRRQANTLILLVLSASLLVTVATLVPINRNLSRSISALTAGAGIIGSGDLNHRIAGVSSGDEIGRLAGAFNGMAENLQAITVSRDELAQEVAERQRAEEALTQNERFLDTIIENAPACVKLVARDGTLLKMNRAGLAILGADSPGQVQGKSIYPIVSSRYRRAFMDLTERVFSGGSGTLEFEAVDLTGRCIWLSTNAVPLYDNEGKVMSLLGITTDITDRKRTEQQLIESEERLRLATEAANAGTWSLDLDTGAMAGDAKTRELFGLSPGAEITSTVFLAALHGDDRERTRQAIARAQQEGSNLDIAYRAVWPDGSEHWLLARGRTSSPAPGRPGRMNGTLLDITERRQAELELERSKLERERYAAQLDTIFNNITDGLVVADLQGRLFRWNPAAVAMHGFASEEEGRRRLAELTGVFELSTAENEVLPLDAWPLARVLRGETLQAWEVQVRRRGTDWLRVFSYGGTLARDREGRPLLAVVVVRDITERKRRDEEFRKVSRQNELILEHAGEGIFGLDLNGDVTFVNSVGAHMLGYERSELMGSNSHRKWHYQRPDRSAYPEEKCPIYAAYTEGTTHSGEEIFWRRDGTGFPADYTSRPLYEGTRIAGAVVMYRDVTERKRAEESIRRQANLINLAYDSIFVRDRSDRITFWNRGAEAMYGWSREDALGRTPQDLLQTGYREPLSAVRETLFTTGTWEGELEHRRRDGSRIAVESRWAVLRDDRGEPVEIMEANRDITARKRAEEDLRQLLADLERSNKELEQFAYVASHDLQEPLRMVASFVQLLERRYKGRLDEKADRYIRFAVDGVTRMQKLIDGLLAYSRVARGAEFRRVDAGRAAGQAVANLSIAVTESGAVVTLEPLPRISGDEVQLSQLFQNLIGNALKFRKPDAPPRIRVGAKREGREWIFSVSDNGIGIDPRYSGKIFQIFQRLHSREEYPGTGIGLALCKRIVERHRGRIWVEPNPEGGTTFFFTLPAGGLP